MAKQSNIEKFLSLSDKERTAAAERAASAKSRPLTAGQRAKWNKVQAGLKEAHRRGRGRPVTGQGVKAISVSVEKALLARTDAKAKQEGISRAALIARGLERILA